MCVSLCMSVFLNLAPINTAVTVHCPEHPEVQQLSKRLPSSMTVQKLKGLLQRVYRVDWAEQRLAYLDSTVC